MDEDEQRVREREATLMAYKKVFNSKAGKLILDDLIKSCHFFGTSAIEKDSHMTYFYEGERNIVVRILNMLNKDPSYISNLFNIKSTGGANVKGTYTNTAS